MSVIVSVDLAQKLGDTLCTINISSFLVIKKKYVWGCVGVFSHLSTGTSRGQKRV